MNFIEADDKNFDKLKRKRIENKKYSSLFIQASTQRYITLSKKDTWT